MSSNMRWMLVVACAVLVLAAYVVLRPQFAAPQPPRAVPPGSGASSEISSPVPADSPEIPPPLAKATSRSEPEPPILMVDPEKIVASFSGRVTDLQGKPIASATVVVVGPKMSASTDAHGYYEISIPAIIAMSTIEGSRVFAETHAPTQYELFATHEDYSESDRVTVLADKRSVNFTLRPLGAIEGRVVAARTGQPITDFRIRAELEHNPARTAFAADFKRVRDDAGRFRLERIKAGISTISVGANGFADTTVTFPPVLPGETRERVEVRLEPGAVLQGQVVNQQGQTLRMAQVSGGYPRRGDVTDSEGAFELNSLPTGPFEVTAKHADYAPKTFTVNLGNGAVNRTRIVMTSGTVLEGEFTVGGKGVPGMISVHVEREQPEGARARARALAKLVPEDQNQVLRARAGEDGRFRILQVPAGPLRVEGVLEMSSGCACTWRKTIKLTVVEGTTNTVDLHFPANDAIVKGMVYVAPAKSLGGFGSLSTSYADFTPEGETNIVIDARTQHGYYSICLPSGRTGLWLSASPEPPYDGPQTKDFVVDLKPGDHIARDIFLYGGATLRITLSGPAVPKSIAVLALFGEVDLGETLTKESMASMAPGGQGMMGPDGIVKIWGLEPGTYTLCAVDYSKATDAARVLASAVVRVEKDANMDVALAVE